MQIHWLQLIGQVINVFVLVWLLNRFLYRPLLKIVDDRNRRIKEGLELAKKNQEERHKIKELERQRLAEAEKRVMQIIQQAKEEAQTQAKKIIEQAQYQAKTEADKQRRLLMEEIANERNNLRIELINLVVSTSRKVLSDLLDEKIQKRIIESELKALKKAN